MVNNARQNEDKKNYNFSPQKLKKHALLKYSHPELLKEIN